MFCDVCKAKEATVFLTQMIEGNVQKLNLCEPCSKLQGVHDPMGFALADLLLGLGAAQEIEKTALSCPVCGFSQHDFKKRGRLGCSSCYDAFAEGLSVMLRNMHRGVVHIGKIPAKLAAAYQRASQLETAKKMLALAISNEEYEEAARHRDLIYQIEAGALDHAKEEKNKNKVAQKIAPVTDGVNTKKKRAIKAAPPLPPPEETSLL